MESIEFDIKGMTCSHCAEDIAQTLMSLRGVIRADVNLDHHRAHVEHDGSISPETLIAAVEDEGYLAHVVERSA